MRKTRLENCIVCGKPLKKRGTLVCEKCRTKGWIDCKAEMAEKRKKTLEDADEVLRKLVEAK
jgi:predicted nucleic acid-binding Zn ribbon protein